MYLNKDQIKLLNLVNAGHKTAGNFSTHSNPNKEHLLLFLKNNLLNLEIFFHPLDANQLEFCNKELFKDKMKEFYPELQNESFEAIINNRKKNFKKSTELFLFYGRVYDYPEICIKEFIEHFNVFPKEFVKFGKGIVSVYYKSNKAKKEAKEFIQKIKYKSLMNSISNQGINLFNDVYYFPRETKYGIINSPNLIQALTFAGIPFIIKGHSLYNAMRLSAQIPSTQEILISKKIKFKYDFSKKFIIQYNSSVFKEFSLEEIKFMSILNGTEKIFYDKYFKNKNELTKHINYLMKSSNLDLKKLQNGVKTYQSIL